MKKIQEPSPDLQRNFRLGVFARAGLLCALGLGLWPQSSRAQTNTVATNSTGNRYLFILETSRSMQRRSAGVLKAVQDLLASGVGGQLRRGDTLGIWTYNEQLYAGRFPLQQWSPEAQRATVSRALAFLQDQTYEKQGALSLVLPALDRLIKQSAFLTVILISDGEQKIHGTPFDEAINQAYGLWQEDQQKARMPFLTVLRAQGGRLTAYSVNPAPWPVDMPPLPQELLVPKVTQKKAAPATPSPKPPPPVGRSLIISGKKPEQAAISNSAAPLTTNAPTVTTGNLAAPPVVTPPQNPTPAPSDPSPVSSSAPAPAPAKAGPDAGAPATRAAQEPPATVASLALAAPPPPDAAKLGSAPTNNRAAANAETSPSPSVPLLKPEPAPVASPKAPPDANPAPSFQPPTSGSLPPDSSPEPPIAGVQYPVSSVRIWTVAGPALAAVAILVLVWIRRSRSSRHASLISRSLDREKP